jgi:hypothetical protein
LRDASQTSSDDEVSIASVTLPEDVEAGARHIVDPAPLHRSLVVGDRIVFKFNPPHGEGFGTYVSQGNKKYDRDKSLCKSYDDLDLSLTGVPQATTGGGDDLAKQASKRTSPTTSISSSKTLSKAATQNMGRKLFSPVVNRAALMSIIALAVTKQMTVFICDVKGAFLYADLFEDEAMYVRPPKDWQDHRRFSGKIMKLKKALYGLRQAPRRWYKCLQDALVKSGLVTSLKDHCVMYLRDGDFKINVGTHVDDLLFSTTDSKKFDIWFKISEIQVWNS